MLSWEGVSDNNESAVLVDVVSLTDKIQVADLDQTWIKDSQMISEANRASEAHHKMVEATLTQM